MWCYNVWQLESVTQVVLFDISVRLHVGRPESRLVEQIVLHILKKLNYASSSDLKGLVGMDSRMKQIEALLCTQLPEVCFVGIWGMGGSGKTTIAGEIFNKIAREYEGHYFLANGTGKVEGIFLDVSKIREIELSSTALERMKLTYLNLNETAVEELPQSIGELSGLVTLNLKNCKHLVNIPENIYLLKSLQIADFSGCSSISRLPDFSRNIRYLYLNGTAIEELPSSIDDLRELIYLDLSGCSSITEFPKVSNNIKELYLNGTAIREIPSSIECLCELHELHLQNCKQFKILPSSICKLRKLQRLNLSGCLQFRDFPEVLKPMNCLRYLYLEQTRITKLPSPIGNLQGLACLEVGNCKYLNYRKCFVDLSLSKIWKDLYYLRKLNLDGCHLSVVPDSLGYLSSLELLDLSGNDFKTIPISINKLLELQYLGLRNCKRLESLPELPPQLSKLDADNCESLNYLGSSYQSWMKLLQLKGNIFEFIFTNCLSLCRSNQILPYSLMKFQLYTEMLHQLTDVPEGACSFYLPGSVSPHWLSHQSWGSTVTCQLPLHWVNSKFLGFSLCAVIAFHSFGHSLQVKCTYHFSNEHGDNHDLYCYLHGWYDEKHIDSDHLFVGLDPCLVVKENDMFSEYSEVSIEFQLEDINGNLLPLDLCQVHECGVRLLYEDEIHCINDYSDALEAMFRDKRARFQDKRARFQGMSWEDYSVMRRTYEFLEEPDVSKRVSSFYLNGDVTPEWFSHQSWGSTVTCQLSSHWANSKFLGFSLCAVIAFYFFDHSLQVKCTYHFRNKHGDSRDLNCYHHGWYDERRICSENICVGFDPCLVVKENDMFNDYSEVSVEFQLEDINGNLLPLDLCRVHECGVRLLYEDEIHCIDYYCDALEARFQDKRARFQDNRARFQGKSWEDYSVMCRTYEFLEEPDVSKRVSSFCLYGDATPKWFSHQSWGSTVTCQLSSHWANSKFLGFSLCAVIAFSFFDHSSQVKCTYHFRNEHGDSHDLYCYLHGWNDGWNDERRICLEHIFVGFDPCLVVKEKNMFNEYIEVSVEFQLEDMNGNLLPLDLCQVHECGVRLLYEEVIHYIHFYHEALEAMFQCKRARFQGKIARFQGMSWEDYFVICRTYEFLEEPDVSKRVSSFYLYGDVTPKCFSHQSWGSTVTCQLSSHWANSEFLGFSLCAVIAFHYFKHSLQVKCTYHFRNEHDDSHDLYCYLHGWYDERRICSEHIFVGFDPCLVVKENDMFSKYNEVLVEFQPEDMNGMRLALDVCECGVRLLDAKDKHGLETWLQAHRIRLPYPGATMEA
ncbi:hypothetical protein POTOM_058319 [Populus tomentosa]|uniref:Uncharacterized protein n=1 Tax=Populus tomentosa TaxID=118781 RepID=A0A8X8C2B8_POPTO|nr:hypothetical protein POTOM_058319 [Populus tomentosa]